MLLLSMRTIEKKIRFREVTTKVISGKNDSRNTPAWLSIRAEPDQRSHLNCSIFWLQTKLYVISELMELMIRRPGTFSGDRRFPSSDDPSVNTGLKGVPSSRTVTYREPPDPLFSYWSSALSETPQLPAAPSAYLPPYMHWKRAATVLHPAAGTVTDNGSFSAFSI